MFFKVRGFSCAEEPTNRSRHACFYERSHYIYENKALPLQNELSQWHPAGQSRPPVARFALRTAFRAGAAARTVRPTGQRQ
jgi:hypothetical protein